MSTVHIDIHIHIYYKKHFKINNENVFKNVYHFDRRFPHVSATTTDMQQLTVNTKTAQKNKTMWRH